MIERKYTTYFRVPLNTLIEFYGKQCYKKEVHIIGHAYDACKDEVIIEITLPEKNK